MEDTVSANEQKLSQNNKIPPKAPPTPIKKPASIANNLVGNSPNREQPKATAASQQNINQQQYYNNAPHLMDNHQQAYAQQPNYNAQQQGYAQQPNYNVQQQGYNQPPYYNTPQQGYNQSNNYVAQQPNNQHGIYGAQPGYNQQQAYASQPYYNNANMQNQKAYPNQQQKPAEKKRWLKILSLIIGLIGLGVSLYFSIAQTSVVINTTSETGLWAIFLILVITFGYSLFAGIIGIIFSGLAITLRGKLKKLAIISTILCSLSTVYPLILIAILQIVK